MRPTNYFRAALAALALLAPFNASAQWLTQSIQLKGGWNAVYLHVDAGYGTLQDLVANDAANPINQIWLWNPSPSTIQFITSPQQPTDTGSQWLSWDRQTGAASPLERLIPNAAYLIHLPNDVASYTWNLKGKPVPPHYQWTASGLNFIGFPSQETNPPSWERFLSQAPDLRRTAELFYYPGGDLGASNPQQLFAFRNQNVTRGQAYWIRSTEFNRYFGPIDVVFTGSSGARFGTSLGQVSFRLRNTIAEPVTVTLTSVTSEAAPSGQTAIIAAVPVLVRGDMNTATLAFSYSTLDAAQGGGPKQWTLAKAGDVGSELEVVIGVNRQQVTGPAGSLYASILRFTDSLGISRLDVPVTAEAGSNAGLWVGTATITSVNHYLNTYSKAANSTELTNVLTRLGLAEGVDGYHYERDPATQRILVFGGPKNSTGYFLLDGATRVDPGTVARPFPLRLIIHNDGTTARLLQQAYYGIGLGTNPVVATRQNLLLPAALGSAKRISAVHLPLTTGNVPWAFTGPMRTGSALSTTVTLAFDDQASNPFLHSYHPDHDNRDATFQTMLPQGEESYGVRRQITLNLTAPAADFEALTKGGSVMSGSYSEIVSFLGKGSDQRDYTARGEFTLNRITDIATLTQ